MADYPLPPGLAGYAAGRQQQNQEQMQGLQALGMLSGLQQQLQQQAQYQQLRGLLSETGGDPEKLTKALIETGNIAGLHQVTPFLKLQQEAKDRQETRAALGLLNAQQPQRSPWEQSQSSGTGAFDSGQFAKADVGLAPQPQSGGLAQRREYLSHLANVYANNPIVMQRIQAEIDRLQPKTITLGNRVLEHTPGETPREIFSAPMPATVEHNFPVAGPNGEPMVQPHRITYDAQGNAVSATPLPGSSPSPKFAKQVAPTITMPQPAVTPVTIQDPNDPDGTLIIDGRTKAVLGKGPKLTDTGKMNAKRQFNMSGIGAVISEAETLLTNKAKPPTQSGIGNIVDRAASIVGVTPAGAPEADRLRAVGGALVAKMPRMEGPQSDKDVALYKEMAGMVGDATIPTERRVAALDTVKLLWEKYEKQNPNAFAKPSTEPLNIQDAAKAELERRRGKK